MLLVVCATLLAQMDDALAAAACAAWAHGRAGEIAVEGSAASHRRRAARAPKVRGVLLDDVTAALGSVWSEPRGRAPVYPALCTLPAVGAG